MVEHHPEAQNAVVGPIAGVGQDKGAQSGRRGQSAAAHADEPPFAHSAHPGHDDEQGKVHQDHAEVAGEHGQEPCHESGQSQIFQDGGKAADALFPLTVQKPGEHGHIGQLGDLAGLKAKGQTGNEHPAAVAGAVIPAEGLDEQDHRQPQQENDPPPFFHEKLNIDKGDDKVEHHTHAGEHGLLEGEGVERRVVPGGAVYEQQARPAGQQAQKQQDDIAFFEKIPERAQGVHHPGSLLLCENRRICFCAKPQFSIAQRSELCYTNSKS